MPDLHDYIPVVPGVDVSHRLRGPSADVTAEVPGDVKPVCQVRHEDTEARQRHFRNNVVGHALPLQDGAVPS